MLQLSRTKVEVPANGNEAWVAENKSFGKKLQDVIHQHCCSWPSGSTWQTIQWYHGHTMASNLMLGRKNPARVPEVWWPINAKLSRTEIWGAGNPSPSPSTIWSAPQWGRGTKKGPQPSVVCNSSWSQRFASRSLSHCRKLGFRVGPNARTLTHCQSFLGTQATGIGAANDQIVKRPWV